MPENPRKRKSTSDDFTLSDAGTIDIPAAAPENNGSNGTLTARAETGSLKIKIRRTGKSPATTPVNGTSTMFTTPTLATPSLPQPTMSLFTPMMNPAMTAGFMAMPMPMGIPMPMPMPMMPMAGLSTLSLTSQPSATDTTPIPFPSLLAQTSMLDLGPPPPATPSLAVEHSLMGGGIETQNVVNVDTKNFDWNRKTASATATEESITGRPRSESLPNLNILDGLSLHRDTSFFKEI
ncbi:hypothetical protein THRCLA_05224 [Thraustotheca clavata]|uniref:Uncharacterized protein n=1 Tax=Thraustotheca clavata TaxID=74557 RepID=A0A1V9ZX80_9STRA|nr:hypothetical protein THRCLA_05224 [Thraustotheca clavata]